MTWKSDDVPMEFFFFSAGLSCQRSGGSAANQLGPVIQTISTSELSVRINSSKKKEKEEEENTTILCHHIGCRKKSKHSRRSGFPWSSALHFLHS